MSLKNWGWSVTFNCLSSYKGDVHAFGAHVDCAFYFMWEISKRGQMKSLRFGKHWVALNVRDSCCSCSSSTMWIVNYWYTQVGIGEQSCKKSIIVSLISPHQKEPWFTPGQRDQERTCLQITASAAQPPKAMLTTHTHHLLWQRHGKSSNTQSQYPVSRIINPLSNYQRTSLSFHADSLTHIYGFADYL